jgi:tyrosyl-tRNA synthetase
VPLDNVARLEKLQGAEINDAKRVLATEATALLHGRDAARAAEDTAKATFAGGGAGEALPTIEISAAEFAELRLPAALTRAGLTASNGEAKRLIDQGAIAVNNAPANASFAFSAATIVDGVIKLTRGKTKHALIKVV